MSEVFWLIENDGDAELANQLGIATTKEFVNTKFVLKRDSENFFLKLHSPKDKNWKPIFVDFEDTLLTKQLAKRGKKDFLARAITGTKKEAQKVFDTTMGFGMDGFFLSLLGHQVVSCERLSWLFALVQDGLQRYKSGERSLGQINWEIIFGNSQSEECAAKAKELLEGHIDVVLCDPLFDEKRGASPKEMQVLHELSKDYLISGEEFVDALYRLKASRVVVKRPIHGHPLRESVKYDLKGRTIRYDVYYP